jgi:hypothetical protein
MVNPAAEVQAILASHLPKVTRTHLTLWPMLGRLGVEIPCARWQNLLILRQDAQRF